MLVLKGPQTPMWHSAGGAGNADTPLLLPGFFLQKGSGIG